MKSELFVVDINYYPEISSLTLPGLERYAASIGAKFTRITQRKHPDKHVAYEKMQIYELGKENDWNILIDCDMLIKEGMYNVIPLVPDDCVGAWQSFWKENLYKGRGIDVVVVANFLVVPRKCHEIFKPLSKSEKFKLYLDDMAKIDEYCLSLNRQRLGYKLAGLELPNSYNHLFKHLNITTDSLNIEDCVAEAKVFMEKNVHKNVHKKKSANAVVTIAMGKDYQDIAKLTHPSLKSYAKKIGADFICIDRQKISQTTPHWEKFQIFDLLNRYERILYFDTDIIVREDCPNLFEIVPEDQLGMFNEAPFTDRSKELLIDVCKGYGITLPGWNGRYYNSGVIVLSRQHKSLFKKPDKEVCNFYEQSYFNMMIAKENVRMFELEHKFNRMVCMDSVTGEERFASYVIHYAGCPNLKFVLGLIPQDLEKWEKDKGNYNYKKHIYVNVSGGYGDQIAAEPAVRWMRENLYPDDEFVIATHWPRIFQHFNNGSVICEHGKANLNGDTPYFLAETLPGPDKFQWSIVSNLLCHQVDYSAIALMHRTLPIKDRQIKFEVGLQDICNLLDIVGAQDLREFIVVHPGKHWNSKTFPVEWWQAVINGLVDAGKKVCVIGKDDRGDAPNYIVGARGTVDVKCPEGAYDLRNLLDLGSLGALLEVAKVLISNDSFPIHLAGAFDNWIILIPSCKHPDHVLPWRNESQYYKAMALYKRLVIDEVESRPTQVYQTRADVDVEDWSQYLPATEEVIEEVRKLYGKGENLKQDVEYDRGQVNLVWAEPFIL